MVLIIFKNKKKILDVNSSLLRCPIGSMSEE